MNFYFWMQIVKYSVLKLLHIEFFNSSIRINLQYNFHLLGFHMHYLMPKYYIVRNDIVNILDDASFTNL